VSVSIAADANPVCDGSTVTITATPVNEGSTPSYQWYNGAAAVGVDNPVYSYTPADGDIITVVLTSSETCQSGGPATSNTVNMTVNTTPIVVITDPAAVCSPLTVDLTDAAVTAGSTAGLAFTYWTDALATLPYATETTATTGTYYIKGTDGSGCYDIQSVTVTVNPIPTVIITNPATVCALATVDLTDPAVTAGSTAGLIFTYWTDAAATVSYTTETAATAGIYYIKGTDGSGCYDIQSVTVTVNPLPILIITDPAAVCSPSTVDLTDPAVTAGSDAALIFTYWTDAAATISYTTETTATAGTYYIKGTDGSGCYNIQPVTVIVNAVPTLTSTQTNVLCTGLLEGEIDITPADGVGPYTFAWTGTGVVEADEDQTGLAAGLYSVIVTDANSCASTSLALTITEPASALTGSITSQTNVSVFGGNDGDVTVTGAGGSPPYQYALDGGAYQVAGSFGTLAFGSYTVTVQDINLCIFDISVSITEPLAPLGGSITSQTNVLCYGGSTGSVTVEGIDGVAPYEYSLDGGSYQSSGTFGSLIAGTYVITVKDLAISTSTISVEITQPASSVSGFIDSQTNVLCFGSNTGIVSVTGTGGVSPYLYKIGTSSYQASGTFIDLAAGTYIVTIQDANLCTYDLSVPITEPAFELTGTILTQTNVSCFGSLNGAVTVAGSGGTSPYEYSFNGGTYQVSGIFNNLAADSYTINVRDANLCTASIITTITEPEELSLDYTKVDASCPGVADGSISLIITGGTPPYNVIWSDGTTTVDREDITDGTYSVVVSDFNGCNTSNPEIILGVIGSGNCIVVQEVITPNNDGYNDTWKIRNIDLFPDAEVLVFSRWGKMVFKTKNVSANEWDGMFKGKLLPTDSYHYILHLNDGSDPRSGVVSIIR
jgi:gliding motility-associated-like protein